MSVNEIRDAILRVDLNSVALSIENLFKKRRAMEPLKLHYSSLTEYRRFHRQVLFTEALHNYRECLETGYSRDRQPPKQKFPTARVNLKTSTPGVVVQLELVSEEDIDSRALLPGDVVLVLSDTVLVGKILAHGLGSSSSVVVDPSAFVAIVTKRTPRTPVALLQCCSGVMVERNDDDDMIYTAIVLNSLVAVEREAAGRFAGVHRGQSILFVVAGRQVGWTSAGFSGRYHSERG